MINSKSDLYSYLNEDKKALCKTSNKPRALGDDIWKFQIIMRRLEYFSNTTGFHKKILRVIYRYLYYKKSKELGFSIPINVFGPGLAIVHYGSIAVNERAKVGKNCRLQTQTIIGGTNGDSEAPTIGDNVYIGSGAKIIGNIRIANNVAIGANAVVVKSITESGTTWGGVPAKRISNNDSHVHLSKMLDILC